MHAIKSNNTAHHNFLGQSRKDSFLLTLKSTTLKKIWTRMTENLCCGVLYLVHSGAQRIIISIAMKTETVVTGDPAFSSLGF